ncbi:protein phosphatase 2C [Artomyces pyxidatus]|uniref:Protein phosphatase 2C n=1 Tax=Artomyces pyxidatus TaxID=48021 RepID=A0ACB8T325_9AGAM|nr:protein phosphatase 2C [Artomyces pyxidatus]
MNSMSFLSATDDVVSTQPPSGSGSNNRLPYIATTPNPWSAQIPTFRFGVADEKGPRRTMEDAHSYVFDYGGVHGQGFFAVFDGHAGKEAADWCGKNFQDYLQQALQANPEANVPDIYNQTFHSVDRTLSRMSEDSGGKIHSGCTAVTAFLRIEDADGGQSFVNAHTGSPVNHHHDIPSEGGSDDAASTDGEAPGDAAGNGAQKGSSQSRLSRVFKRLSHPAGRSSSSSTPRSRSPSHQHTGSNGSTRSPPQPPPAGPGLRRVLYVANAGDARGVLCRGGKALRLTYDHKGTDKQEAKRIMDSGGFVMSGRVNGVLAVTRSLGDSSMKEFVVGAPYTTETELTDDDEFLILACDGIWDVLDDQTASDFIRCIQDPQDAAEALIREATHRYTNDNITVMVIRLKDVTPEVKAAHESK